MDAKIYATPADGRMTPELQDEFDKVWVRFSILA
jgi:hypothetical protein